MTDIDTTATERDVVHEVLRLEGLQPVYRQPRLGQYVSELWARRHFIVADARGRVISGSRGTVLGLAWLVLRPLLDGAAYYVIFGLLLGTRRGIENFAAYLIVGVFVFRFTTRTLNAGSMSLITGRNLVKAFAFPRAALPLATAVRETLSTVPSLVAMVALILAVPPAEHVTFLWFLFPVVIALQVILNAGLALSAARLTARIPDLQHLIPVLVRFWFYGSGVFFSIDRLSFLQERPGLRAALEINPMYVVLDMSRDLLLYGRMPDLQSWGLLIGWAIILGFGGFLFFWRGEERYGSV